MTEHILVGIVSVLVLGIGAQWLAWRFRVPSILLLLIFGFVAGPVTGLLEPSSLQGDWVFAFVSLSIGVILFEGGLNLRLGELREVGVAVRNLITVGVLVTWAGAGLAAYYLAGFNLNLAILVGAILTVTGPTVVIPLLRHVRASGRVGTIAKWEGITIDPVGAVLAVLVLETILLINGAEAESLGEAMLHALEGLFLVFFISVGVSITGAAILILLLRRRLVPDYLQSSVALLVVVSTFALSNILQEESGLLEVTLMGIIMANQKYVPVRRISEFKENLQVLLIGCLFVVLAARLELSVLDYLDANAFLFLGALILLVRPLSVLISSIGTNLSWKEQAFMAWLAPRGIVAAAVASLFAFRLEPIYPDEVGALVPLVFLVIVGTVAVYGLTIAPFARALGLAEPDAQGLVVVGAHTWARRMAQAVAARGYKVLLVDSNAKNVEQAQSEGLRAETANALSESALDELNLSGLGRLLAMTPNDEVNSLAALNFSELFETNDIFQLASRPELRGEVEGMELPMHLRGRPLFGTDTNFQTFSGLFNAGGEVMAVEVGSDFSLGDLREEYGEAIPLFIDRAGDLIIVAESLEAVQPGDVLLVFVSAAREQAPRQDETTFEQLVTRAFVIDLGADVTYEEVAAQAAGLLAQRMPIPAHELKADFMRPERATPITRGAALPHTRRPYIDEPELVLVRCASGLCIEGSERAVRDESEPIYALFFLVSPEDDPRRHLRILANLASRIDDADRFLEEWRAAEDEQELKETLLHHERFLSFDLQPGTGTAAFIDQPVGELDLPTGTFVALLQRANEIVVPSEETALEAGDRITIVGDPAGIHRLYGQYRPGTPLQASGEPAAAPAAEPAEPER